jgi:hypothetical protein
VEGRAGSFSLPKAYLRRHGSDSWEQERAVGAESTCLMECGPKAVAGERLRKMVDDLDGKRELLGELGLLRAPGVCDAEVAP